MPDDIDDLIEEFIDVQVNETVDDEFEDHREQVFKELAAIRKENHQMIEKHFINKRVDPYTLREDTYIENS